MHFLLYQVLLEIEQADINIVVLYIDTQEEGRIGYQPIQVGFAATAFRIFLAIILHQPIA